MKVRCRATGTATSTGQSAWSSAGCPRWAIGTTVHAHDTRSAYRCRAASPEVPSIMPMAFQLAPPARAAATASATSCSAAARTRAAAATARRGPASLVLDGSGGFRSKSSAIASAWAMRSLTVRAIDGVHHGCVGHVVAASTVENDRSHDRQDILPYRGWARDAGCPAPWGHARQLRPLVDSEHRPGRCTRV